jgi:glutamate synthase (NADPH/NADH) small chain
MGKITGFLEFERQDETYEAPKERIKNYFLKPLSIDL